MNYYSLREIIRQNWYLLCLFLLLLVVMVFWPTAQGNITQETRDGSDLPLREEPASSPGATLIQDNRSSAQSQIEEYLRLVQEKPQADDAPSWLTAAGNLYCQRLMDYEKAAQCYEQVLQSYSSWENLRHVYVQLATCYERLEDWEKARRVYRRMMDAFPVDSQEHLYAKAKYEGSMP